jgi:hypothetical protein
MTTAFVLLVPRPLFAQDWLTVMTEQMAKFEVTLQELKQGYNIVQKGLSTIGQIKQGDYDLHNLFFTSLQTVSPQVKGYVKIADILAMETQILSGIKRTTAQLTGTTLFSGPELTYVSAVLSNLGTLVGKDITELTDVVTDGDFQMTDDQRLARIDKLYKEVTDKYAFFQSFQNEVRVSGTQRLFDKNSLQTLQNLYQP